MAADSVSTVLITGGDGYLGLRVARQYLARSNADLLLWVRARDEDELAAKRKRLGRLLQPWMERVRVEGGDLRSAAPFTRLDPRPIRTVVHAAAQARFNVAQTVAQAVNIDGTARVLAFARRCPRLERLAVLSTLHACGLQSGRVEEAPFTAASGFANFYEWSKWEAEQHVLRDAADLPWRLLRIATVIADDETGAIMQRNTFHRTLQLFYHGLLSLLPGDAATPLYFVTGDFVADAVYALTETTDARGIYHLAHERGASCTLGELVATACAIFERDPDFRRRRILPPLLCDWESFSALAEAVEGFSSPEVKHGVRSVAPFARQLFSVKDVDHRRLVARYAAYRAPDARALVAAVCTALLRSVWRHDASGTARADAA